MAFSVKTKYDALMEVDSDRAAPLSYTKWAFILMSILNGLLTSFVIKNVFRFRYLVDAVSVGYDDSYVPEPCIASKT